MDVRSSWSKDTTDPLFEFRNRLQSGQSPFLSWNSSKSKHDFDRKAGSLFKVILLLLFFS